MRAFGGLTRSVYPSLSQISCLINVGKFPALTFESIYEIFLSRFWSYFDHMKILKRFKPDH